MKDNKVNRDLTTISIYREDLKYLDNMAPNMKHKEILRLLIHFLKSMDAAISSEVVYKGEFEVGEKKNLPKTS